MIMTREEALFEIKEKLQGNGLYGDTEELFAMRKLAFAHGIRIPVRHRRVEWSGTTDPVTTEDEVIWFPDMTEIEGEKREHVGGQASVQGLHA